MVRVAPFFLTHSVVCSLLLFLQCFLYVYVRSSCTFSNNNNNNFNNNNNRRKRSKHRPQSSVPFANLPLSLFSYPFLTKLSWVPAPYFYSHAVCCENSLVTGFPIYEQRRSMDVAWPPVVEGRNFDDSEHLSHSSGISATQRTPCEASARIKPQRIAAVCRGRACARCARLQPDAAKNKRNNALVMPTCTKLDVAGQSTCLRHATAKSAQCRYRRAADTQAILTVMESGQSLDTETLAKTRVSRHETSQHINTPFTRYSQLYNRFDNRLYRVYKHSTGCQTGFTTGCIV